MGVRTWLYGRNLGIGARLLMCAGLFALPAAPSRAQDMEAAEPLFSLSAVNVTDVLSNVHGGLHTGTRVLDKFELGLRFLGNDTHWPGVSAFLNLQATSAAAFSETLSGDMQNISNINAPAGFRVANAWIAKSFAGRYGIKGGIVDLNTEFDVQTTGAVFLNASHGIGPDYSQSGLNGPAIFPSYALGAVGWGLAGDHWEWKGGVFEGTAGNPGNPGEPRFLFSKGEGVLLAGEIRNRPASQTVLGLGGWMYTAALDMLEAGPSGPRRVHGNAGLYGLVEGLLYSPDPRNRAGLRGWLRAGLADDRINAVDYYAGGGLVYNGPFRREADQIGIAVAYAHFGEPGRRAALVAGQSLGTGETNIELTYSLAVADLVTIQPDLQYVISPGADRDIPDALVVGTRIVLAWP